MNATPNDASNPTLASLLQFSVLVGRVAELGSLAAAHCRNERNTKKSLGRNVRVIVWAVPVLFPLATSYEMWSSIWTRSTLLSFSPHERHGWSGLFVVFTDSANRQVLFQSLLWGLYCLRAVYLLVLRWRERL